MKEHFKFSSIALCFCLVAAISISCADSSVPSTTNTPSPVATSEESVSNTPSKTVLSPTPSENISVTSVKTDQPTSTVKEPVSPLQCLLENGLCYGPFRDGQSPKYNVFPTLEQVHEDLLFIKSLTNRIRTYSSTGIMAAIPEMAESLGISIMQGVDLSDNKTANEAEILSAIQLANQGLVDSIVVGNESLTLSRLSKSDLISYIHEVKNTVPAGVRVSTAEFWDQWRDNLDLVEEVDSVIVHLYPFWEGHPIEGAASCAIEEYRELEKIINTEYPDRNIEIVIGETGWPSCDTWPTNPGENDNSEGEHQRKYIEEFFRLAYEDSIPFYYFDAFDEEWKWEEGYSGTGEELELPLDRTFSGCWPGSSWGIYQSNGDVKTALSEWFPENGPSLRTERDVFVMGQLSTFYDIGVDSSEHDYSWLSTSDGSLKMSYPAGQEWGVVFLRVGAVDDPDRPWKDFSEFDTISFEIRGAIGGETLDIGVKDWDDPDDGGERKVRISGLTAEWQTINIPLESFSSSRFTLPRSLERLYIPAEFVFSDNSAATIFVRNIRYLKSH